MSDDLMLLGVLNMPLPDDTAELDIVTWMQVRQRMNEAAARIEELTRERDHFRAEVRRITEGWSIQAERAETAEARADRLAALLKEAGEALRWIEERADVDCAFGHHARAILARLEWNDAPNRD